MAKAAGRNAKVYKNAVLIGGVRVSKMTFGATPIDIQDGDSSGLQEFLPESSTEILTFNVEGVYKDPVLRDIALTPGTSKLLGDMTFKFSDALAAVDTIGGSFFMTAYEETNDYKDATQFTASFTSSGAWTRA